MNSGELRVGNLVKDTFGRIFIVICIDDRSNAINVSYKLIDSENKHQSRLSLTDASPIELTEDWLVKAEFTDMVLHREWDEIITSPNKYFVHDKILFYLGRAWDGEQGFYFYSKQCVMGVTLKYVHQLMNLFYALTGEELTIKTNEK